MVNIFLFMTKIFSHYEHLNSRDVPARLNKKTENKFQEFCRWICPYVIILCLIILSVLLFIALARYGHVFSTEANRYEHLQQIVTK